MSRNSHHGISLTSGSIITKLFFVVSQLVHAVKAMPLGIRSAGTDAGATKHHAPLTTEEFYLNMLTSVFLVLAGGVFAGLTLGLMGQDEVYLKVIASSGEPDERKHARKVLRLIGRGKHWVLVTLLLCNVITNETLPIVLDNCLGGGWPAVVASTASIVVFGEIIPQSICVRYGLQVGSMFAPFVLVLMYIMYPIAYPCALLLDHLLGEDHGTVYKKSGLKTLVTLHRTLGTKSERLQRDEVTIISAVLDLKEKSVSDIMTPIDRVYTMSSDRILNEKTVEEIFNAGFSRIPIHLPNEPHNFIGMLLVRVLISYDPEDALPVSSFPLATLPETSEEVSCLNILNYFQVGKSHMVVVSDNPGEPYGARGVLTLEDVIEELIGEEIIDESDVYIDINNNIKRKIPGPLSKRNLTSYLHNLYQMSANNSKRNSLESTPLKDGAMPKRNSFGNNHLTKVISSDIKTLKPKNPASNPLETDKSFVTIKKPAVIDAVVPPPNRSTPEGSNGYGAIHVTEAGAIREAQDRNSNSHDGDELERVASQRFIQNEENSIRNGGNNENGSNTCQKSITIPHTDYKESRSYRTGGIIESVVNVQGVHKTIIQDISDDEAEESFGLLSNSYKSNHSNH